MFPSLSIISALALAILAALAPSSSARPIPHSVRLYRRFTFVAQPAPPGWSGAFEDYESYHFRYLAISCHTQHDSSFFKACCHPRRKAQTDASFPAQCSLSPGSIALAAKIVEESLDEKDSAGKGKAVYVHNGTVEPMKAIKVNGGDSTRPPTEEQLNAVAKAEAALTSSSSYKPHLKPDSKPPVGKSSASSSSSAYGSTKSPNNDSQPQPITTEMATSAGPTPMVSSTSTYNRGSAATVSPAKAAAAAAASASAAAAQHAAEEAHQKASTSASSASVKAAQATQASSSGSSSSGSVSSLLSGVSSVFGQNGGAQATFFYQNGVAGACGAVHSDSTPLVALETTMYANGAHCGRKVLIKNTQTGAEVKATVTDECPTCATPDCVDLSTGAFKQIGQEVQGVLPIVWGFVQ